MAALFHQKKTGDPVYDSFIKRSLGTILPECIQELTERKPADPIEFISNSLYKAVDSQLYRQEKEKYMNDCVRESALIQEARDKRRARLDSLLDAQREAKEAIQKARAEEIAHLTYIAQHAAELGIDLSPRSRRRIESLREEEKKELEADKPIQVTMPHITIGADGVPIVTREGEGKGRWKEVEEQITTESGTVITVKRRKWSTTDSRDSEGKKDQDSDEKRKGMSGEFGSIFTGGSIGGVEFDTAGIIAMTARGQFIYTSGAMGKMAPPDPLDRRLAPADNPDMWIRDRFDCHSMYDHELYAVCIEYDHPEYDVNQHNSPPRMLIREFLESVSRASTSSEEEKQEGSVRDSGEERRSREQSTPTGGSTDESGY